MNNQVIVGCKVEAEVKRLIDDVVRRHETRFFTRSDFIRESIRRSLREWGFAEKDVERGGIKSRGGTVGVLGEDGMRHGNAKCP
jgi:Arc/MetJ-type ribon-helix-helix transcriptional regulator